MDSEYESLILAFEESKTGLWEVFSLSDEELVQRVHRSINEIRRFREYYAAKNKAPLMITGNQLEDEAPLSTGIPCVDDVLGGGLMRRSVTEISGPAGTGKTCLSCQIALAHQEEAVYFCLEESGPILSRRMKDIADVLGTSKLGCQVASITSYAELRAGIAKIKQSPKKPSIIIIDSIVAALASDSVGEVEARLNELDLQKLAFEIDTAIVVTNHVRAAQRLGEELPSYHYSVQEMLVEGDATPQHELRQRPAHGLLLSEHISTRILISRSSPYSARRELQLVHSRWAGPQKIELEMRSGGLQAPPDLSLIEDDSGEEFTSNSLIPESSVLLHN